MVLGLSSFFTNHKPTRRMKIPKPTWELVSTSSRGRIYWGFAKRGSSDVTLIGQSRREALQVINELYRGQPYVPVVGEAHNVAEVEDIADEESLDADTTEDLSPDRSTKEIE